MNEYIKKPLQSKGQRKNKSLPTVAAAAVTSVAAAGAFAPATVADELDDGRQEGGGHQHY